MKPTVICTLMACVIYSCSSIKAPSAEDAQLPSLTAIGKEDKSLLQTHFKQVGEPHLNEAIAVSASAVPFDRSSFKRYAHAKANRGEAPQIQYVDSLPVKPKYLRFEVKDKIALQSILNEKENDEVRSYLTKDSDCKIVSSISLFMTERQAELYHSADGLFLSTSTDNMLRLELIIGTKKTVVNVPQEEIFDYELMGFCWGEDVYGRPQIETLNHGKCPDGTEKNAQKLADLKPFLKI